MGFELGIGLSSRAGMFLNVFNGFRARFDWFGALVINQPKWLINSFARGEVLNKFQINLLIHIYTVTMVVFDQGRGM